MMIITIIHIYIYIYIINSDNDNHNDTTTTTTTTNNNNSNNDNTAEQFQQIPAKLLNFQNFRKTFFRISAKLLLFGISAKLPQAPRGRMGDSWLTEVPGRMSGVNNDSKFLDWLDANGLNIPRDFKLAFTSEGEAAKACPEALSPCL